MLNYLKGRLTEWSTWLGAATAFSAFGWTISEDKLQAAFQIATFVLAALTAGVKDKGSEK